MKIMKKIIAVVLTLSLLPGTSGAATYSDSAVTSGGSGGKILVHQEVFKDYVSVHSSAYRYDYGAKSYINTDDEHELKTNFTLTGTLYSTNSSKPFSATAAGTEVSYTTSSSSSSTYHYIATKTVTKSTAFGNSSKELNHTL